MRIVIANELYKCGGAENVYRDEIELCLAHGDEVRSISFDPDFTGTVFPDHYNIPLEGNVFWKYRVRTLGDNNITKILFQRIDEFNPDVIHVHNAVNSMMSLTEAIRKYKASHHGVPAIQTLHDFGVVCPKAWCIHDDGSACSGFQIENCTKGKCHLTPQNRAKLSILKKNNSIRKETFDRFVSPSKCLAEVCKKNDLEVECIRNLFNIETVPRRTDGARKKAFVYVGAISRRKGCSNLLKAWRIFSGKRSGWKLRFIGKIDADFENEFNAATQSISGIEVVGPVDRKTVLKEMSEASFVIVPSLWLENYPTTVLEAMACGTLVLGSNRGGIPELVTDRWALFNPLDPTDIAMRMNDACDFDTGEYQIISQREVRKVTELCDSEQYYKLLYGYEKTIAGR